MAGRQWTVENHPKKAQIIKALISGSASQRSISDRFGVPKTSLQRYLTEHLAPQAAEALVKRRLSTGSEILEELERIMSVMQKLYGSAEEFLRDPDNPDKLYLGPRDFEVDVVYVDRSEDPPVSRRQRLDLLMEQLEKKHPNLNIQRAHYHHTDPRDTIVKVASVLTKQLELVGRILGEIKDVKIDLTKAEAWALIKNLVVRALKKHPAAMKAVVDEIGKTDPSAL